MVLLADGKYQIVHLENVDPIEPFGELSPFYLIDLLALFGLFLVGFVLAKGFAKCLDQEIEEYVVEYVGFLRCDGCDVATICQQVSGEELNHLVIEVSVLRQTLEIVREELHSLIAITWGIDKFL